MRDKVLQYIRRRSLLRAGDRVAVAVSGGADSVALLRVLLELKAELGVVLFVAHFNHALRDQAAADEAFVAEIAKEHGLEFFAGRGDVRDHAFTSKLSIEAAGRELRYRWFASLAQEQRLNAIATAHTLDDQAETVLLKFLRGAGTRGLAGIYPLVQLQTPGAKAHFANEEHLAAPEGAPLQGLAEGAAVQALAEATAVQRLAEAMAVERLPEIAPLPSDLPDDGPEASSLRARGFTIIRPLLGVSRQEVEAYLTSIGQSWREDESNLDRRFLRNRVRHELLPLLERDFNPNVRRVMSDLAEIARGDEDFWQARVKEELMSRFEAGAFALAGFGQLPLALQRRLLKSFAERQGLTLDYEHIERLRSCAAGDLSKTELPGGIVAVNHGGELSLRLPARERLDSYCYELPVPGEIYVAEAGLRLRAYVVAPDFARETAPGALLSRVLVGEQLTVRNWLPGDRYCPAHSRSEEKLKRLFSEKKIPAGDRSTWPVALCGDQIVWVRGFSVAKGWQWQQEGEALQIEAVEAEG